MDLRGNRRRCLALSRLYPLDISALPELQPGPSLGWGQATVDPCATWALPSASGPNGPGSQVKILGVIHLSVPLHAPPPTSRPHQQTLRALLSKSIQHPPPPLFTSSVALLWTSPINSHLDQCSPLCPDLSAPTPLPPYKLLPQQWPEGNLCSRTLGGSHFTQSKSQSLPHYQ